MIKALISIAFLCLINGIVLSYLGISIRKTPVKFLLIVIPSSIIFALISVAIFVR